MKQILLEFVILLPLVIVWLASLFMFPAQTLICSIAFGIWLAALCRYLQCDE